MIKKLTDFDSETDNDSEDTKGIFSLLKALAIETTSFLVLVNIAISPQLNLNSLFELMF